MITSAIQAKRPRIEPTVQRIAARMEDQVARAFKAAVKRLQLRMDVGELAAALKKNEAALLYTAAHTGDFATVIGAAGMAKIFQNVIRASGEGAAQVVSAATGIEFGFNYVDPASVLYARRMTAELVVKVTLKQKETIRKVVTAGQGYGLTVDQQARAIRTAVGLPPNWAEAPGRLAQEIRELKASAYTKRRRISAVDRARIRKAIKGGKVTESFVAEMEAKYASSLVNRRAMNIARTETLRAANHGQRLSWSQAMESRVLPRTARRFWIVTPDEYLRDTHAAVPGLNPKGVKVDGGVYETPLGPSIGPPLETNCRCTEGLAVGGLD